MGEHRTVPVDELSAALDEIYRLRQVLAYEACGIEAHLDYATFPKSRRAVAEDQVARMRLAAAGHSQAAYAGKSHTVMRMALREAGASETFTRNQWQAEITR
jgi:hypothetical protein